jgi:hypothetical protein
MGRRYDAVFMDILASEFRRAGGSVLAGGHPLTTERSPTVEERSR